MYLVRVAPTNYRRWPVKFMVNNRPMKRVKHWIIWTVKSYFSCFKHESFIRASTFWLWWRTKTLAKQTRKSTQVYDLHSTCISFGHPLTCIDLHGLWSSSNLYTSRHKLISSELCMSEIYDLHELVNLSGHLSQVRKQVLVLQTCNWLVSQPK